MTPEEAQQNLSDLIEDLIEAALKGERVLIGRDQQHAVELVPVAGNVQARRAGTARGLITMRDDFDAPLPDFDEYTA